MSQGISRKKLLDTMIFPMSVGDLGIAAGLCWRSAKRNIEWLFSVGVIHKSYELNGKILYHKAELQHAPLPGHITAQEIADARKKREEEKKTEETAEINNPVADIEQQNFEDEPIAIGIPEDTTEFEKVIEED